MNDLISKQAAIESIRYLIHGFLKPDWDVPDEMKILWKQALELAILNVRDLTPAQQERKGKWVLFHDNQAEYYELKEYLLCSSCRGRALYDRGIKEVRSDYCPNCGAKMEEME